MVMTTLYVHGLAHKELCRTTASTNTPWSRLHFYEYLGNGKAH